MGSQAERMCGKAADLAGEVGLAEQETKDSNLQALKHCGDCDGGRNSQSHRRVYWKVGLEQRGIVPSLTPPLQTAPQHSKESCPVLANT